MADTNGEVEVPASTTGGAAGTPSDFLKGVVGHQVVVRLNSGVDYRGELLLV